MQETFESTMGRIKALSEVEQADLRRRAIENLDERMAGSGCGISSSDVNHTMVAMARDEGI